MHKSKSTPLDVFLHTCIHPNLCQSRQRTLLSAQKLHTPSQSSPQPLRDNHSCAFVHPQVIFSSFSCKWNPVCTLLCKATCTLHNVFEIHFMMHRHFIFYCLVVIHGTSQFVYPFSFQWPPNGLWFGAVRNRAAMNILVQVFIFLCGRGIARCLLFSFMKIRRPFLKQMFNILHSP